MLEIKNLNYIIKDQNQEKKILQNIDLAFNNNKIYVITGQNGSGKSTLLKIIMGIIHQSQGDVFYDGKNISNLSIYERSKLGISFAFQQPVTFKGIKVKDLLNIASEEKLNLAGMCEILSKVGLCAKNYIDREINDKLSGGELKRIELATVLARKAKINMFDEPEAGIDLWSFENLTTLFKDMDNSINIIVSHQRKILEIADEIIVMKDGEILLKGEKDDVLPMLSNSSCGRLRG